MHRRHTHATVTPKVRRHARRSVCARGRGLWNGPWRERVYGTTATATPRAIHRGAGVAAWYVWEMDEYGRTPLLGLEQVDARAEADGLGEAA